ncbi:MAG: hypothetical protein EOO01_04605 [Chitinophagaceae bacterium]|nr:MAG: hypothetical protein EOO01_04605 [Chitinophagaceae bacterium]
MTLNQIVNTLRRIVGDQRQIGSLYYGRITEWVGLSEVVYPSCVVELESASLLEREVEFRFTIYVADLLNADFNNRTEIHSDTLLILKDLLAMMDDPQHDWVLNRSNNAVEFFDDERGDQENPDNVAGVKTEITVRVSWTRDACQIPRRNIEADTIITEDGLVIYSEDFRKLKIEKEK